MSYFIKAVGRTLRRNLHISSLTCLIDKSIIDDVTNVYNGKLVIGDFNVLIEEV